jgi:hypothetical protein
MKTLGIGSILLFALSFIACDSSNSSDSNGTGAEGGGTNQGPSTTQSSTTQGSGTNQGGDGQGGAGGNAPFECSGSVTCSVTIVDCSIGPNCSMGGSTSSGGGNDDPVVVDVDDASCVLQAVASGEGVIQITVEDQLTQYLHRHHVFIGSETISDKVTGHEDIGIVDDEPRFKTRVEPSAACLASQDPGELAQCLYQILDAEVVAAGGCECDALPDCGP